MPGPVRPPPLRLLRPDSPSSPQPSPLFSPSTIDAFPAPASSSGRRTRIHPRRPRARRSASRPSTSSSSTSDLTTSSVSFVFHPPVHSNSSQLSVDSVASGDTVYLDARDWVDVDEAGNELHTPAATTPDCTTPRSLFRSSHPDSEDDNEQVELLAFTATPPTGIRRRTPSTEPPPTRSSSSTPSSPASLTFRPSSPSPSIKRRRSANLWQVHGLPLIQERSRALGSSPSPQPPPSEKDDTNDINESDDRQYSVSPSSASMDDQQFNTPSKIIEHHNGEQQQPSTESSNESNERPPIDRLSSQSSHTQSSPIFDSSHNRDTTNDPASSPPSSVPEDSKPTPSRPLSSLNRASSTTPSPAATPPAILNPYTAKVGRRASADDISTPSPPSSTISLNKYRQGRRSYQTGSASRSPTPTGGSASTARTTNSFDFHARPLVLNARRPSLISHSPSITSRNRASLLGEKRYTNSTVLTQSESDHGPSSIERSSSADRSSSAAASYDDHEKQNLPILSETSSNEVSSLRASAISIGGTSPEDRAARAQATLQGEMAKVHARELSLHSPEPTTLSSGLPSPDGVSPTVPPEHYTRLSPNPSTGLLYGTPLPPLDEDRAAEAEADRASVYPRSSVKSEVIAESTSQQLQPQQQPQTPLSSHPTSVSSMRSLEKQSGYEKSPYQDNFDEEDDEDDNNWMVSPNGSRLVAKSGRSDFTLPRIPPSPPLPPNTNRFSVSTVDDFREGSGNDSNSRRKWSEHSSINGSKQVPPHLLSCIGNNAFSETDRLKPGSPRTSSPGSISFDPFASTPSPLSTTKVKKRRTFFERLSSRSTLNVNALGSDSSKSKSTTSLIRKSSTAKSLIDSKPIISNPLSFIDGGKTLNSTYRGSPLIDLPMNEDEAKALYKTLFGFNNPSLSSPKESSPAPNRATSMYRSQSVPFEVETQHTKISTTSRPVLVSSSGRPPVLPTTMSYLPYNKKSPTASSNDKPLQQQQKAAIAGLASQAPSSPSISRRRPVPLVTPYKESLPLPPTPSSPPFSSTTSLHRDSYYEKDPLAPPPPPSQRGTSPLQTTLTNPIGSPQRIDLRRGASSKSTATSRSAAPATPSTLASALHQQKNSSSPSLPDSVQIPTRSTSQIAVRPRREGSPSQKSRTPSILSEASTRKQSSARNSGQRRAPPMPYDNSNNNTASTSNIGSPRRLTSQSLAEMESENELQRPPSDSIQSGGTTSPRPRPSRSNTIQDKGKRGGVVSVDWENVRRSRGSGRNATDDDEEGVPVFVGAKHHGMRSSYATSNGTNDATSLKHKSVMTTSSYTGSYYGMEQHSGEEVDRKSRALSGSVDDYSRLSTHHPTSSSGGSNSYYIAAAAGVIPGSTQFHQHRPTAECYS